MFLWNNTGIGKHHSYGSLLGGVADTYRHDKGAMLTLKDDINAYVPQVAGSLSAIEAEAGCSNGYSKRALTASCFCPFAFSRDGVPIVTPLKGREKQF